jgi:hypothetical protein
MPGSKIEQAKQKFREEKLTFERIRSLPGRENITHEEYEEICNSIMTLADIAMDMLLSGRIDLDDDQKKLSEIVRSSKSWNER